MQRFILSGDLHANKRSPRYRKDDYWQTWQDKMSWIVKTANDRDATALIAGDIFDTSRVYADTVNTVLDIFNEFTHTPIVVAGQHDLKFHTSPEKTPLKTLELAGAVVWADKGNLTVTGVSFEEPIPKKGSDILLIHTCITPQKPPFFLGDAVSAKKFLKKYKNYQLIVSGDYHPGHKTSVGGRYLINVGTIIRNKKDMQRHAPCIWYLEMDNGKVQNLEQLFIPHDPFDAVFDTESIAYDEKNGISIDTAKMKELMQVDITETELDNVIWSLYKNLKKEGKKLNKAIVERVLDEC